MKPIDRVKALLEGKKLDVPAINLWKHFPPYDENPVQLVRKITQFQERFNWDFVKVTYQGLYSIQDWGSWIKWPERNCEWPNTCAGVGAVTDFSIKNEEDWTKLRVLSMDEGAMKDAIDAVKGAVSRFKGEAPVVVTVFNPLTTAVKMSGDKMFIHMRRNPESFKKGLEVITQTTVELVKSVMDVGADGIFFASQLGNFDKMSVQEYETFGTPYDLEILSHADKGWFNIMHMHGNFPMFEIMSKYPVQALNWHDRLVDISLKQGRQMCRDKLLIGGVDEFKVLPEAGNKDLKAHLADALQQVEDGRIILGPGCCVPSSINEDRFELAKKLLKELFS
ncbi:MAG: uroporphyrinogen decarboxylase family protein [Eubacteriales bacterium]|nr:uroporphyrinogen decarboxylase family protein [Eubacteriales bacterium]